MAQKNHECDPLKEEKSLIAETIFHLEFIQGYPQGVNRQKNAPDSTLYRMKGNELFKSQSHNLEIHQKILERYSQSIALAPNKSEELAMAYGNRSALLLHLKKYKECLEDCNRAIDTTKSELLKAKLICRRLECMGAIGNESFESERVKALKSLKRIKIDDDKKSKFMEKIYSVETNTSLPPNSAEDSKDGKKSKKLTKPPDPSELFEHHETIPCASKSVTIQYNKKWGRHIVATQDIDPGEIVAVEKHFHKFVFPDHLYLSCSYCIKFSWSSIPCENCIYGVYCSRKCRAAAWEEFHKFECKIYPHVWDIAGELVSATHSMRIFLLVVHKAGGIEKLRQEFMDMQKLGDPYKQGFSDDGVFYSDRNRSVLSLQDRTDENDRELAKSKAFNATVALYYLIKETTFFGKRMGDSLAWVVPYNDLVEFAGAIYLRVSHLPVVFGSQLVTMTKSKNYFIGQSMSPFCGLFNHSCDPNVVFIRSKNNETIVYAKHPIKEGEQLFRSYFHGDYNDAPKEERMDKLSINKFTCKCLACENNWSTETLPKVWAIAEKKIGSRKATELVQKIDSLLVECMSSAITSAKPLKKMFRQKSNQRKPGYLKEVLAMLKEIADKASVHCQEYEFLGEYVLTYYLVTFGRWLDVPENC